ncbi:MAG: ribonuclease HI [Polaribacter sp.]
MSKVEIYTDGACRGNPGPGGWGVWLIAGKHQKELFGGEPNTTNNRMELMAAIEGLAALKSESIVILTTDSQYVRKGITEWLSGWKLKGWKNSQRKPVKNADLWKLLDTQNQRHQVDWQWVKGHSGHPGNEKADELANKGIDSLV